jgi:hypothetical protein
MYAVFCLSLDQSWRRSFISAINKHVAEQDMQIHKERVFYNYVWMENEVVVEGHKLTSQRQVIDQSTNESRYTQQIIIRDDKSKMCRCRKLAERGKADVHFAVWSV